MLFWWFLVIPLVMLWVYALVGVVQRDMKGWKKAAWVLAILWLPFLGAVTWMLWSASTPAAESEEAKLSPADTARLQYGTRYVATVSEETDVLACSRRESKVVRRVTSREGRTRSRSFRAPGWRSCISRSFAMPARSAGLTSRRRSSE
jgi:hypothetical protein